MWLRTYRGFYCVSYNHILIVAFICSTSVLLTSSSNTAHFDAGFYGDFDVTTNVSDANGTVAYTHHIHNLSSTTETIEDDSFSSGSSYGSDYSTTKGGCYQEPTYTACNTSYTGSHTGDAQDTTWGTGGGWFPIYGGYCPKCGKWNERGNSSSLYCTNSVFSGYKANCGYTSGQVLSVTITY